MSIEPEQIESVKITASLAEQQPKAVSVQPKALDVFSPVRKVTDGTYSFCPMFRLPM